jgi:hypothetical protein
VSSLDPARHWLAAGITGLARGREWDAIATVEGGGSVGDEAVFVALEDGRLLPEGRTEADLQAMAGALAASIDPPYRALARRQPEFWAVGAVSIEVVQLRDDPGGDSLEIVRTDEGLTTTIDDAPTGTPLPELERLGEARGSTYVVRANRLDGPLFEVESEAL